MRRNLRVSLSFERTMIYLRKELSSDSAEDNSGQTILFEVLMYISLRGRLYTTFVQTSGPFES
jgi:hypothetical protein